MFAFFTFLSGYALGFGISALIAHIKNKNTEHNAFIRGYREGIKNYKY